MRQLETALAENYESEINLLLPGWMKSLQQTLTQGLVLLIDYGFPQREYYHPDRDRGTLMCHYRHHSHDDPLLLPGLQDITAHVDFTAVATTARTNGFTIAGYTTQAYFLLSCGIVTLVEQSSATDPNALRAAQQIKKLTLPNEMGELFKVMALTRNFTAPLLGFNWYECAARYSTAMRDKMLRLTTIQLSKEYHEFSAGHFTMFSATHRERMHGHNFTVNAAIDVVVQDNGIAFDYVIYKKKLSTLCKNLNGYFLLPSQSPYLTIEEQEDYYVGHFNNEKIPLPKADVVLLPLRNISVEELARWLA